MRRLLPMAPTHDPRLLIGPRFGEDAAVLDLGDGRCLVAATDPVTFAAQEIGWYAVHINANDVAALGADPAWLLVVLLLPETATGATAADIMQQVAQAASELGLSVIGGHTEVTPKLDRPIVVATALGTAPRDQLRPSSAARSGDRLVICGPACVEGTALLALEHPERARKILGRHRWKRAVDFLRNPGISVVAYARAVRSLPGVRALHDPTEGGVLNGAYEMAVASGCGVTVDADRVPLLPETRILCEGLDVDPLRALASGSLLVAVAPEHAAELLTRLERERIPAAEIGRLTSERQYVVLHRGLKYPLRPDSRDEVTRIGSEE